ncbi:MAG: CPBP family glutamic-type intramembrane protease [Terriglobia bacterium]
MLAFVILTHFIHHDKLRAMGLTAHEARASAEIILPVATVIYGAVVVSSVAVHRMIVAWPHPEALGRFAGYGVWCCFQQYLMQCYFFRRLQAAIGNPHGSALVVALMFGGAHVPNPVLMIATTLGGLILSEVFACHPNIWPLALAQTAGGILLAAVVPASLIHNMRVGPGYYTY